MLADARDVRIAVSGSNEPVNAMLYRPEHPEGVILRWSKRVDGWDTLLPAVGRHAVITWSSAE
jgi:hypothetical protein